MNIKKNIQERSVDSKAKSPSPGFNWGLIVPPGFEELARRELALFFEDFKISSSDLKIAKGLIEFTSDDLLALWLNAELGIPTRLLLRIESFRCRDFPKLFNKIKKMNWQSYLNDQVEIHVEVSSHRSRLNMKQRIAKTVLDAIYKKIGKAQTKVEKSTTTQSIYIRFDNDLCTLSIDTSGDALYKRGIRTLVGEAPMRENLAQACLQHMLHVLNPDQPIRLIDPMMGSGLFLIEALLSLTNFKLPRNYAFENWAMPIPKKPESRHLWKHSAFAEFFGCEIDAKVHAAAKKNLETLEKDERLAAFPVTLYAGDYKNCELTNTDLESWIISNPPYNQRLTLVSEESYSQLIHKLKKRFNSQFIGLILPRDAIKSLDHSIQIVDQLNFLNGGQPVSFIIIKGHPRKT